MEIGGTGNGTGAGGGAPDHPRKRKAEAEADDLVDELDDGEEEGVIPGEVAEVEGCKHGDGSIFKPDAHPLHSLYHLHDTRETRLEPMRLSGPTDICHPSWTACRQHVGCSMLQFFSLKLSKLPRGAGAGAGAGAGHGPVEVYGFMAARDLLDPLRNYVFNRSRDDPFVIQDLRSDPFIYLSGPKRGIYLQCRVLLEYDMRVKIGDRAQDDLPLIDGAATFSELTYINGAIVNGIHGDRGARLDIARALLHESVEATVEVWVTDLEESHDSGLDLCITGLVGRIPQEIKIFRGAIGELCDGKRFVVAVRLRSVLFLYFKAPVLGTDPVCQFAFRAKAHGFTYNYKPFRSSTMEVKVSWSSLE